MMSKSIFIKRLAFIGLAFIPTIYTSARAEVDDTAEKVGQKMVNAGDSLFTSLTKKSIKEIEVNHPVSLYDYDEASSAYEDAFFNGRTNMQNGNQDRTSYDLDLSADYEKVIATPDYNTKFDINSNGSVSRGGNQNDERLENWNLGAAYSQDRYFHPETSKVFWYGKGSIDLQNETDNSDFAGLDDPLVVISAGVGYGRVVNVTPMAKAIRVVEALIQNGTLTKTPSKSVYNSIAEIIAKEDEFRSRHGDEDYAQFWVKAIEKTLGMNLGARGAIRAYDVLTSERISTRRYGWDTRIGAGVVAHDYEGESGDPIVEAELNYYYPISNRMQFSNETGFLTILNSDSNTYSLTNDLGLTYELSDRVDWVNTWNLDYQNRELANNILTNTLASSYRYYISNVVSADFTLRFDHIDDDIDNNLNDDVVASLLMGVNYRLK